MWKLRMAIVLPLVHVAASIAIFGFELAPSGGFNGTVRWWFAMNAPVLLLIDLAKRLATTGLLPPTMVWGGGGERTIYLIVLVGGLAVWFFVGRAIDSLWRGKALDQKPLLFHKVLIDLFLIACGIRLIFHGLQNILPQYAGQRPSTPAIVNGVIILVWSLLLILLPALKLLKRIREKPSDPNPGTA